MGFVISETLLDQMIKHAESVYPDECCGFLLGSEGGPQDITDVVPIKNIQGDLNKTDSGTHPRTPKTGFFMDPEEQLEAMRRCREGGLSLKAVYHSHPDNGAYFSDEDKKMAAPWGEPMYPGVVYVVISVIAGKAVKAGCFIWDEKTEGFNEVPIESANGNH